MKFSLIYTIVTAKYEKCNIPDDVGSLVFDGATHNEVFGPVHVATCESIAPATEVGTHIQGISGALIGGSIRAVFIEGIQTGLLLVASCYASLQ